MKAYEPVVEPAGTGAGLQACAYYTASKGFQSNL